MLNDIALNGPLPLFALKAISNGALSSDSLPTRIKLLNWGKNETVKGPVILDDASVAAFSANQRARGFDRVALDYEHNTIEGSPEYERTKEPRDVAGYGTPEMVQGDGLYLSAIDWTPSGRASAKNFSDLSPAPSLDKNRRVIFLHSVALVRNGAVFDLTFFSAVAGKPVPNTENPMTTEELNAAIAAALKPIGEQLTTLGAELKTLKEAKPLEPVITLSADGKETKLSLADAGAKLMKLEADLVALSTNGAEKAKAELVAKFAAEGKVPLGLDGKALSEDQLKAFPIEQLQTLHVNTPATVPLSVRGKKPGEGKSTDGLTGLERAIAAHKADRN